MLTGRQQQRERPSMLFARQMQLRRPPTPGATQRMVGRFGHDTAGRFDLRLTLTAGTGGVLMRPHDRRVDADVPGDLVGGVGPCMQPGQHLCPGAVALPAITR
ncbi:hypothetical protein [Rhodococcus pyridinivorans]|uniref:hypothetical protein n=1 Tax=Rhodococcus pyridinivorans TaxID=103816 RepID=UPI003F5AFBF5